MRGRKREHKESEATASLPANLAEKKKRHKELSSASARRVSDWGRRKGHNRKLSNWLKRRIDLPTQGKAQKRALQERSEGPSTKSAPDAEKNNVVESEEKT